MSKLKPGRRGEGIIPHNTKHLIKNLFCSPVSIHFGPDLQVTLGYVIDNYLTRRFPSPLKITYHFSYCTIRMACCCRYNFK